MPAITEVRIHPAIGIARVGNSPDEFFIGPETDGDDPPPPGGYKDAGCRIKRQAARFRLYGYEESGKLVGEVTADATTQISWTVHLANRKAAALEFDGTEPRNPGVTGAARDGLVIDPGPRTLTSPNARAELDTGSFTCPVAGVPATVPVPLGEIRTDESGRLLVLGGFGKSGSVDPTSIIVSFANNDTWYDDVADGPVTATVVIDGVALTAKGAWVIVAPPDFAPDIDTVHSLYARLISAHWPPPPGLPSYSRDIYPLLLRASRLPWTRQSTAPASLDLATVHGADQATRTAIVRELGTLPGRLAPLQRQMLNSWAVGDYIDDWAGVPPAPAPLGPDVLDRVVLEACVGGAFFPGIEAGAFVDNPANFSERLRIDHATVPPGGVTARMAIPWQADFYACAGDHWWPAQRPNLVLTPDSPEEVDWDRGVTGMQDMVGKWATLGFVVRQEERYVEAARCPDPPIALRTPQITFAGELGIGRRPPAVTPPIVSKGSAPGEGVT